MSRFSFAFAFILALALAHWLGPQRQAAAPVAITSPLPGQALQGTVPIQGSTAVEGFRRAELAFAYSGQDNPTWFIIAESDTLVSDGVLAQWDTTTMTDGDYDLRLQVSRQDGQISEVIVASLRVRNYSPVEAATPGIAVTAAPLQPTLPELPLVTRGPTLTPTITPTPAPTHTPTPAVTATPTPLTTLQPNPAQIYPAEVVINLGVGALVVMGIFAVLGLYGLLRSLFTR